MSSLLPPAAVRGLIDDAAVFPPGNAPLDLAVARHRRHRSGIWSDLVGPLLIPAGAALDLVGLTDGQPPIDVVVIARVGTAADLVDLALDTLAGARGVRVVGVELGLADVGDVEAALDRLSDHGASPEIALSLEVGREDLGRDLDTIAAARAARLPVQAKFRTGATPVWRWPTESELADFIVGCVARELPFKLTGGLHHLIRAAYPVPDEAGVAEEQHGLANVLTAIAATHEAAAAGEVLGSDASYLLADRDPARVIARLRALTGAQLVRVRSSLTAYGCCEVLDPIADLITYQLIEETPHE